MITKSKKELIIEGFQKMDSSMLEILLDDSKTYQDATKEVFLEKINNAFLDLKKSGDTFLSSHKGCCNSNKCDNKGCSGYSFVGNNSKNHIDLIFEESENEINDIFQCYSFEVKNNSIESGKSFTIDILPTERAGFIPSVDFLIEIQNCRLAYDELMRFQETVIDKEVYLEWLEKYYYLYKSFDIPPIYDRDLDNFYWLYSKISDLKTFLQSSDITVVAVKEFHAINNENEHQLLKWLVKYEKLGNDLILFSYKDIDYENPEKNEYFMVGDFKISILDFNDIIKFKFWFDKYYRDMLEKYKSDEENEITFRKKYMTTIKEKHILESAQKYKQYLVEYKKSPREDKMLENEEEFINYLKDYENHNSFFMDYLREYFEYEFHEFHEKLDVLRENLLSLKHHLKISNINI